VFIPAYLKSDNGANPFAAYYLKGRPVWGPHPWTPADYVKLAQDIASRLEKLRSSGGLLVLPFPEKVERSVVLFLSYFAGRLRLDHIPLSYSQFLHEPYLELPAPEVTTWLIHQAPKFQDISLVLEDWLHAGRVVLATGQAAMWKRCDLKVSYYQDDFFLHVPESAEPLGPVPTSDSLELPQEELLENLLRWVVLTDAWGVPLPFELLVRLVNLKENEVAQQIEAGYRQGALFWVERDKPVALLVASRSEGFARQALAELVRTEDISLNQYQPVLQAADPDEHEERYAILNLLESWLVQDRFRHALGLGFHITQVRALVQEHWRRIQAMTQAGSAAERLIWTQCLERLGLFEQGKEIIKAALKQESRNIFLLQTQAHLLSRWSQVDPQRQPEAVTAFAAACDQTPNNVYLWQARGVFEAERPNRRGAELCFARALEIDPHNIPSLIARADMYLEAGESDKASKDLQAAEQIDPNNIYVRHLFGRWHVYQGDWEKAQQEWEKLRLLDKGNLYALQSLGHMARIRGQWQNSCQNLQQALDLAPENVTVLLELAMLALERTDTPDRSLAAAYLNRALRVEPENPKLLVTQALLLLRQGDIDAALQHLEQFLRRWPDSLPARHLLGQCYYEKGDQARMADCFQQIIDLSRGKNLHVYLTWSELSWRLGQRRQARQLLEAAQEIYQDLADKWSAGEKLKALVELAKLSREILSGQETQKFLDQALEIEPEYPALRALLASLEK